MVGKSIYLSPYFDINDYRIHLGTMPHFLLFVQPYRLVQNIIFFPYIFKGILPLYCTATLSSTIAK